MQPVCRMWCQQLNLVKWPACSVKHWHHTQVVIYESQRDGSHWRGSLYGLDFVSQTELWCALFQKDFKVALNAVAVFKKIKNKSNVYSTDLISSAWWYHVWKWPESYSKMSDSVWLVFTRSETKQVQVTFEQCKDSWTGLMGPALETPYHMNQSSFPQWHDVLSLSQSDGV